MCCVGGLSRFFPPIFPFIVDLFIDCRLQSYRLFFYIYSPHKSIGRAPIFSSPIEWRCRRRSCLWRYERAAGSMGRYRTAVCMYNCTHLHSTVMCRDTAAASAARSGFPETIQEGLLTISLISFLIFCAGIIFFFFSINPSRQTLIESTSADSGHDHCK